MSTLAFLYAWANSLVAAVDDTSTGGVPSILWIVLVVLLIVCALVYLVRRHW